MAKDNANTAIKKNKKRKIFKWLFIGLAGLIYGISEGAVGAASSVGAVPVIVGLSSVALQATVLTLGGASLLLNAYISIRAIPEMFATVKRLFSKNNSLGKRLTYEVKDENGEVLKDEKGNPVLKAYSKKQKIALFGGSIAALATATMLGVFAFTAVEGAVLGVASLFGVALATASMPWLIPVAAVIAVFATIVMFSMLFPVIVNGVERLKGFVNAKLKSLKNYIHGVKHLRGQKRAQHIAKGVFTVLGLLITVPAAIISVIICGKALSQVFVNSLGISQALANVLTTGIAYISGSITLVSFGIRNAVNTFGTLGKAIGTGLHTFMRNPGLHTKNGIKKIGHGFKSAGSQLRHHPGKFALNILKGIGLIAFGVFAVGMIAINAVRNGIVSTKGDETFHNLPGMPSDNKPFHDAVSAIQTGNVSPLNSTQAPLGKAEIAALGVNTLNSATSGVFFAKGNIDEVRAKKTQPKTAPQTVSRGPSLFDSPFKRQKDGSYALSQSFSGSIIADRQSRYSLISQ